jgi:hypothetical protein
MKLPVQALVVTRAAQIAGVGLVVSLLGCVASVGSVARDTFLKSYTCPAGQLTVNPVQEAGVSFVQVVGCGHGEEYVCQAGHLSRNIDGVHVDDASPTSCSPRERIAYEATDGSIHEAWGDAAQGGAAIASAVHDLPCPRASIVAIDDLTLEGCGQRVTYRAVAQNIATPPGHQRITDGRRYTLVGRIPISGAVASATPRPPACRPPVRHRDARKDTDCKGDRVCVQGQCADPTAAPGRPAPTAR